MKKKIKKINNEPPTSDDESMLAIAASAPLHIELPDSFDYIVFDALGMIKMKGKSIDEINVASLNR